MEGETVIAGVDTHKDVHVLCLLDGLGRKIWSGGFRADPEGYDRLAEAIGDPASCAVVGVEGTASYWIGNTYLDDSGRDSPASLNSTGDM